MAPGQTRSYTVTGSPIDCVWGDGNIADMNNAFLAGAGHNDLGNSTISSTEAAPHPETFNLPWTFLGSTQSWNNGPGTAVAGLTFSNSSNTSTNFLITPALAGGYGTYALGVKDGGDPKWAVFLLNPNGGLSGVASMTGGSFSHFALFGTQTRIVQELDGPSAVPEPASLTLLGSGLLMAASKVRKRLKNRS